MNTIFRFYGVIALMVAVLTYGTALAQWRADARAMSRMATPSRSCPVAAFPAD